MNKSYYDHVFSESYKREVREKLELYHKLRETEDMREELRTLGVAQPPLSIKYFKLLEVYGITPQRRRRTVIDGATNKVVQFTDLIAGLTEQAISATVDTVEQVAEQIEQKENGFQAANLVSR